MINQCNIFKMAEVAHKKISLHFSLKFPLFGVYNYTKSNNFNYIYEPRHIITRKDVFNESCNCNLMLRIRFILIRIPDLFGWGKKQLFVHLFF